jgi:hypothetical protein
MNDLKFRNRRGCVARGHHPFGWLAANFSHGQSDPMVAPRHE